MKNNGILVSYENKKICLVDPSAIEKYSELSNVEFLSHDDFMSSIGTDDNLNIYYIMNMNKKHITGKIKEKSMAVIYDKYNQDSKESKLYLQPGSELLTKKELEKCERVCKLSFKLKANHRVLE